MKVSPSKVSHYTVLILSPDPTSHSHEEGPGNVRNISCIYAPSHLKFATANQVVEHTIDV